MAKGKDKKLLNAYLYSKKSKNYTMNKESVELFLVVHYLLPDGHKKLFFSFIKNRLKKDKRLGSLFFIRDKEFYLNYLSLIKYKLHLHYTYKFINATI